MHTRYDIPAPRRVVFIGACWGYAKSFDFRAVSYVQWIGVSGTYPAAVIVEFYELHAVQVKMGSWSSSKS